MSRIIVLKTGKIVSMRVHLLIVENQLFQIFLQVGQEKTIATEICQQEEMGLMSNQIVITLLFKGKIRISHIS